MATLTIVKNRILIHGSDNERSRALKLHGANPRKGGGITLPLNALSWSEIVGVFDFDAGNYLSVHADQRCHVDFEDSGNASVGAIECRVADQPYIWADDYGDVSGGGTTIPITGNAVEELQASNGSVTAATLFVLALLSGA